MEPLHFVPSSFWEWTHWPYRDARAALATRLEQLPGQHVIFVRYREGDTEHREWVYNLADIDAAPVIWAHDLGPEENKRLMQYYAGRSFWLFEPYQPMRLQPY